MHLKILGPELRPFPNDLAKLFFDASGTCWRANCLEEVWQLGVPSRNLTLGWGNRHPRMSTLPSFLQLIKKKKKKKPATKVSCAAAESAAL